MPAALGLQSRDEHLGHNRLTREEMEEIFGHRAIMPEETLLFAILEQSIADLTAQPRRNDTPRSKRKREALEKDALEWFNEGPTKIGKSLYLFSFVSICDNLDLNSEVIRKGIMQKYAA